MNEQRTPGVYPRGVHIINLIGASVTLILVLFLVIRWAFN